MLYRAHSFYSQVIVLKNMRCLWALTNRCSPTVWQGNYFGWDFPTTYYQRGLCKQVSACWKEAQVWDFIPGCHPISQSTKPHWISEGWRQLACVSLCKLCYWGSVQGPSRVMNMPSHSKVLYEKRPWHQVLLAETCRHLEMLSCKPRYSFKFF